MKDPLLYQDAIQQASYAVTQAEELLDLAQGRLAKAKEAYLREFLLPPSAPTPVPAGFCPTPQPTHPQ